MNGLLVKFDRSMLTAPKSFLKRRLAELDALGIAKADKCELWSPDERKNYLYNVRLLQRGIAV